MRWARIGYQPALDFALRSRRLMVGLAVVLVVIAGFGAAGYELAVQAALTQVRERG